MQIPGRSHALPIFGPSCLLACASLLQHSLCRWATLYSALAGTVCKVLWCRRHLSTFAIALAGALVSCCPWSLLGVSNPATIACRDHILLPAAWVRRPRGSISHSTRGWHGISYRVLCGGPRVYCVNGIDRAWNAASLFSLTPLQLLLLFAACIDVPLACCRMCQHLCSVVWQHSSYACCGAVLSTRITFCDVAVILSLPGLHRVHA